MCKVELGWQPWLAAQRSTQRITCLLLLGLPGKKPEIGKRSGKLQSLDTLYLPLFWLLHKTAILIHIAFLVNKQSDCIQSKMFPKE